MALVICNPVKTNKYGRLPIAEVIRRKFCTKQSFKGLLNYFIYYILNATQYLEFVHLFFILDKYADGRNGGKKGIIRISCDLHRISFNKINVTVKNQISVCSHRILYLLLCMDLRVT